MSNINEAVRNDVKAAFGVSMAVCEAIRELGQVPSGHLYANLMGFMDFETYNRIIAMLKRASLIEESGAHELRWIAHELRWRRSKQSCQKVADKVTPAGMTGAKQQ